jgi:hypothetical protein
LGAGFSGSDRPHRLSGAAGFATTAIELWDESSQSISAPATARTPSATITPFQL